MTEKNLGGRPEIVLTDEQIAEVEELAGHFTLEQTAEYFGISKKTFISIRERSPEVFTLYKKGRAKKHLRYSKMLEAKAMGESIIGDSACLMFYLKTQSGWREKETVNHFLNEPITMSLKVLKTGTQDKEE